MKVREFVAYLKACEQEREVLISRDDEGNGIYDDIRLSQPREERYLILYPSGKDVTR